MLTFPNHRQANPPFLMDEGLLSISPVCIQLVKILITLESYWKIDKILHTCEFYYCPANGMQNGDEACRASFLPVKVFSENANNS